MCRIDLQFVTFGAGIVPALDLVSELGLDQAADVDHGAGQGEQRERRAFRRRGRRPARPLRGLHDGDDLLAHLVVQHADDGEVGDGGVQSEGVLDLLRVGVHLLDMIMNALRFGQEQEFVLVDVADIAGRAPRRVVRVLRARPPHARWSGFAWGTARRDEVLIGAGVSGTTGCDPLNGWWRADVA